MFEKHDHYEDLCRFLEDEWAKDHFKIDFKQVLTDTYKSSKIEAVRLIRQWDPTFPIKEIQPALKKYFKEQ